MLNEKCVLHRRQYIISKKPYIREDFANIQLNNGYFMSIHRDLHFSKIISSSGIVSVLLGDAIQVNANRNSPEEELGLLQDASIESIDNMIFTWSGRWTLLCSNRLYSDACGLLSVYYGTDIISSSLALVAEHCCIDVRTDTKSLKYGVGEMDWYPGPLTLLPGVFKLLPTYYLEIGQVSIKKQFHEFIHLDFFQYLKHDTSSIINELVSTFDIFYKNLSSKYKDINISLTGGVDSRTLFALAEHSGIAFSTWTFERDNMKKCDKEVPLLISNKTGVNYQFVKINSEIDREKLDLWDRHTLGYAVDEDRLFFARNQYPCTDKPAVIIRGHVWGLSYMAEDWTPFISEDGILQTIINRYCNVENDKFFFDSISCWVNDIKENPRSLSWEDSFHLEERLSGWLSSLEEGIDLVDYVRIAPLNCSYLISLVYMLDKEQCKGKKYQKELISIVSPNISTIPYNHVTQSEKIVNICHKLRQKGLVYAINKAINRLSGMK